MISWGETIAIKNLLFADARSPRLHLSQWIEREIVLPEGTRTLPGRVRLWPYQRGIADATSDPEIGV
jgi:hypothetical protein